MAEDAGGERGCDEGDEGEGEVEEGRDERVGEPAGTSEVSGAVLRGAGWESAHLYSLVLPTRVLRTAVAGETTR